VDDDWSVTTIKYENTNALAHTTQVAPGKTLVIAGGFLTVGDSRSNCWAALEGGTVQLGTAGSAASLRVGFATLTGTRPNNILRLASAVNALNASNLWVGHITSGQTSLMEGDADLSGATISQGETDNVLRLSGDLVIGGGRGRGGAGILRLPPSLTELTVNLFEMGYGQSALGRGTLDFGANSQLTRFTTRTHLYVGGNGQGTLTGWPTGVHVTAGRPEAPASMAIGCTHVAVGAFGTLALTNGSFTAWLNSLRVGCNLNTGGGNATGVLDLASTSVQIGEATNAVMVHEFRIGGDKGRSGLGVMNLPPAITNITVGIFELGAGSGSSSGNGTLNLGANSQLKTLIVSNEFSMGNVGSALLIGFPTGVTVQVGQSGQPASMSVGCSAGGPATASFALTNGAFRAWLTHLKIGNNSSTGQGSGLYGLVDLSASAVQIGDAPNAVNLPQLQLGAEKGRGGNGTLVLPASVTNFTAGKLEVAAGVGMLFGTGLLDFGPDSQLETFSVTNEFTLSWFGRGSISNLPPGVRIILGSPEAPIPAVIGISSLSQSATLLTKVKLPEGGRFEGWLTSLQLALNDNDGYFSASQTAVLDLTNGVLDGLVVTGDVQIGNSLVSSNVNGRGTLALPAGSAVIGGTLWVGDEHSGSRGGLYLEGTHVTVSNRVVVGPTGAVTNRLSGAAGGLDVKGAGTNALAIAAGGKIALLYAADPESLSRPYWGLRMKGDVTAYLQSLTSAPARVTFDLTGLSEALRETFGVYYDAARDVTFLGVPGKTSGSLIIVR
jgi:hypothetical protein